MIDFNGRTDGIRKTAHAKQGACVEHLHPIVATRVRCAACDRLIAVVHATNEGRVLEMRCALVYDLGEMKMLDAAPRTAWIAWREGETNQVTLGCDRCGSEFPVSTRSLFTLSRTKKLLRFPLSGMHAR